MARLVTDFMVDTDVLIDSLRGARPLVLPDGAHAACSVITRAELYAGRRAKEQPIEELLEALEEIDLDAEIASRAGAIRRDHGLGLADAVIAATAVRAGRVVLTRNHRDYIRVPGLDIISPDDLEQ